MIRFRLACLMILAALPPLLGCAGSKPTLPTSKDKVEEVRDMLKTVQADKARPPSKTADLAAVDAYLPTAGTDLRSGELVYVWAAGLSNDPISSSKGVAYEKKVASEGGWVLMQDGTVKPMTADEFRSAPKAGK